MCITEVDSKTPTFCQPRGLSWAAQCGFWDPILQAEAQSPRPKTHLCLRWGPHDLWPCTLHHWRAGRGEIKGEDFAISLGLYHGDSDQYALITGIWLFPIISDGLWRLVKHKLWKLYWHFDPSWITFKNNCRSVTNHALETLWVKCTGA